mgnify:CR=1 FL=1
MQKGKQSLCFTEAPFIISTANIVGKKEGEGPLAGHFDVIGEDDKFGQNTWEEAESTLQKEAFTMAVGRAGLKKEDIRYLFAGDLLGQTMATSFGVLDFQVPLFGLYGACSTCVSRCDVCSGRLCGSRRDHDFKPFCQRRKTIQIPARICKPKTEIGHLDSDRKRGFRPRKREGNGKNHRDHNRKNCGFWDQRFHEHGGSHGTSSQRGHQTAF